MSTNATVALKATILCAAFVSVALTAFPAAADDSNECTTPVCTAVVGEPGHHLDAETRWPVNANCRSTAVPNRAAALHQFVADEPR